MSSTLRSFTAVIHRETNFYVAECPEIGTASQGKTLSQALSNLKEATQMYVEDFGLSLLPLSNVAKFEIET